MRINKMTSFSKATRCTILNDTTNYMAHRFFKGENEFKDDFVFIEEVSTNKGRMKLYYNEVEEVYAIQNENGYKIFRTNGMTEIISELEVKPLLLSLISNIEVVEIPVNKCIRQSNIVLDAPDGLLGSAGDLQVNAFLDTSKRLLKKTLVKDEDDTYELQEIYETDYYLICGKLVANKRFKDAFYRIISAVNTDDVIENVSVSINVVNRDNINVSPCGEYIKNVSNGKIVKLSDKYKKETTCFDGTLDTVRENIEMTGEAKEMVEYMIKSKINVTFITCDEYEEEERKKDIFYMFSM